MPFVDETHQHWASQVIQDNSHTPISPDGGGVSVTDGTTTVAASSIVMPSGTVTDLGGGMAGVGLVFRLIGPYHITYQTPGIGSSEDGAVLAALPSGTVVIAIGAMISTDFDASLAVFLGGDKYLPPDDDFVQVCPMIPAGTVSSFVSGGATGASVPVTAPTSPGSVNAAWLSAFGLLSADGALLVQSGGALTHGVADIYAIIATPAA